MEKLCVILNASNSSLYRPRPLVKHAVIQWAGSEYPLSGGIQRFDGPHVVVMDVGGHYGVNLSRFFETHQPMADVPDHYIKIEKVRAWCADKQYELITVVDGKVEIIASVEIGAFVVQNPGGEQYVVGATRFAERYILDE
jgi:hypothetical protein